MSSNFVSFSQWKGNQNIPNNATNANNNNNNNASVGAKRDLKSVPGMGQIDRTRMRIVLKDGKEMDKEGFKEVLKYLETDVNAEKCVLWKNGLGWVTLSDPENEETRGLVKAKLESADFTVIDPFRIIGTSRTTLSLGVVFPKGLPLEKENAILEEFAQTVNIAILTKVVGRSQGWAIISFQEVEKWDEIISKKKIRLEKENVEIEPFPPGDEFNPSDYSAICTAPPQSMTVSELKSELATRDVAVLQISKWRYKGKKEEKERITFEKDMEEQWKKALIIYCPNQEELLRLQQLNYAEIRGQLQYFATSVHDAQVNGNSQALREVWLDKEKNKARNNLKGNNVNLAEHLRLGATLEKTKEEIIARITEAIKSEELRIIGQIKHECAERDRKLFKQIDLLIESNLKIANNIEELLELITYQQEPYKESPKRKRDEEEEVEAREIGGGAEDNMNL
eukprot:Phypoly_transcript_09200.p1 GENE.Phypoly_transcript_09200~~Phypoly_transcript_09200.p1  ORF type:complete len:465 (+),score=82.44 Phypoly_transcript_09200:39-1397(+)